MGYCDQDDIEKLLPAQELAELTAESGDDPEVDVVAEAIAKAGAEIDGYCGVRYAVPFDPVPEVVRSLAADMAIHHLFSRRDQMPEIRRQKYEDAVKLLRDVAKGLASLGPLEEAAGKGSAVADLSSQPRVFARNKMMGW